MASITQEHEAVHAPPGPDRAERRYDRTEAWVLAAVLLALAAAYQAFVR